MIAAQFGKIDTIPFLLELGAIINQDDEVMNKTIKLKTIIQIMSSLNYYNYLHSTAVQNGFTPLILAAMEGYLQVARVLINHRSYNNQVNNQHYI